MFNERWETYKLCRAWEVSKSRSAKEEREEEKTRGQLKDMRTIFCRLKGNNNINVKQLITILNQNMSILSTVNMLQITQHTYNTILLIENIKVPESTRMIRTYTITTISEHKHICYDMTLSIRCIFRSSRVVSASFSGDNVLFIIASNIGVMVPFFFVEVGDLSVSSVLNSFVLGLSLD